MAKMIVLIAVARDYFDHVQNGDFAHESSEPIESLELFPPSDFALLSMLGKAIRVHATQEFPQVLDADAVAELSERGTDFGILDAATTQQVANFLTRSATHRRSIVVSVEAH